jgi:hypothetical protein
MLNPPQHSPNLFVDRARAQVRDRNHFTRHGVVEIRRAGRVRRTQGDFLALFHVSSREIAKPQRQGKPGVAPERADPEAPEDGLAFGEVIDVSLLSSFRDTFHRCVFGSDMVAMSEGTYFL